MRNGALPIPDIPEPPIYFATDLWFAFLFIFSALLGMAILGFIMVDGGHLNDCANMQATQPWIDLCYKANNNIYTFFTVLITIVSVSTIMYFISKRHNDKILQGLRYE